MFWNKKEEKKSLPDLPEVNFHLSTNMPKLPEEKESLEKNALPSFPDSPIKSGFSQAAIKDAISAKNDEDEDGEKFEDEINPVQNDKKFKTIEIQDWSQKKEQSSQMYNRIEEHKQIPFPPPTFFSTQKQQEIYVKIDKFHLAKNSLETIGQKLDEIDNLLKKIRETKLREEQELAIWEKEISSAKSRIQDVRENIFEGKT